MRIRLVACNFSLALNENINWINQDIENADYSTE